MAGGRLTIADAPQILNSAFMQFNEPTFLFLFLPVLLALYSALPFCRKHLLLAASLLFCFWAGKQSAITLLIALAVNYALGLAVAR